MTKYYLILLSIFNYLEAKDIEFNAQKAQSFAEAQKICSEVSLTGLGYRLPYEDELKKVFNALNVEQLQKISHPVDQQNSIQLMWIQSRQSKRNWIFQKNKSVLAKVLNQNGDQYELFDVQQTLNALKIKIANTQEESLSEEKKEKFRNAQNFAQNLSSGLHVICVSREKNF